MQRVSIRNAGTLRAILSEVGDRLEPSISHDSHRNHSGVQVFLHSVSHPSRLTRGPSHTDIRGNRPGEPVPIYHRGPNGGYDRMGKKIPFRWYGGKYNHLDFIIPNLPRAHHYIEPYGGSAAVLINRQPSPVETYNDLDGDVVNFFKVLREDRDKLLEQLALTPFSRQELKEAVKKKHADGLDEIERARLFFVRAGQSRNGIAQEATPGRWAYCKSTSRREMSGNVSRYYGKLEQLYDIADRLRRVQFECRPAVDIIQRFDAEDTLFYCDPPYPHESRGDTNTYGNELSNDEHRELAEVLHGCEAKVAVSGYRCDLYEELFEDQGWYRVDAEEKYHHASGGTRQESLWTNYEPVERDVEPGAETSAGQMTLDDLSDE